MGLILDTNFAIALEREARHREPGAVHAFLQMLPQELYYITFTVAVMTKNHAEFERVAGLVVLSF